MTTENTQALERQDARAVNPATGEVLDLATTAAPALLDELDAVEDLARQLRHYRRVLELELVRRVDERTGGTARTADVDGCRLEVNAPTEDVYDVEAIRRELGPLAEAGNERAAAALRELIVHPPRPAAPPPRVDKRRLNALKATDDRELLGALAAARRRIDKDRTVKVKGRAIDATAEEVDADG